MAKALRVVHLQGESENMVSCGASLERVSRCSWESWPEALSAASMPRPRSLVVRIRHDFVLNFPIAEDQMDKAVEEAKKSWKPLSPAKGKSGFRGGCMQTGIAGGYQRPARRP